MANLSMQVLSVVAVVAVAVVVAVQRRCFAY